MTRYWITPLITLALVAGGQVAASAATVSPAATHHNAVAAHRVPPGHIAVWPGGHPDVVKKGKSNEATSTNWSGYAVTGSSGAFHSVSAYWTEPTAKCSGTTGYAAFWVGLDGYSSDSVEQTGTDSDCNGSTPDYYAWFEMYPAFPVYYTNTVKPGDKMWAYVAYKSNKYTMYIEDITQGWHHQTTKTETGLDRSSAEVITEAPSSSTGVLPLSDFGTVDFTKVKANGTLMSSQSPTQIVMVDSSGNDKDSTSTMSSAGAFNNTWERSN
jgi:hypothetical protein